jgi:hypothetical protein
MGSFGLAELQITIVVAAIVALKIGAVIWIVRAIRRGRHQQSY